MQGTMNPRIPQTGRAARGAEAFKCEMREGGDGKEKKKSGSGAARADPDSTRTPDAWKEAADYNSRWYCFAVDVLNVSCNRLQ